MTEIAADLIGGTVGIMIGLVLLHFVVFPLMDRRQERRWRAWFRR